MEGMDVTLIITISSHCHCLDKSTSSASSSLKGLKAYKGTTCGMYFIRELS
jgi:hypothetical protein